MNVVNPLLRAVGLAVGGVITCVVPLLWAFFVHLLIVTGVFDGPFRNPYASQGICFSRDQPGATSRYVEYTVTTCSSPRNALAEPVGADQAALAFEDTDGDGRPEAVVESSWYKCKFGQLGCYGAARIVLRICGECDEKVTVLSEQRLPQLERE
jgi:hypothetical protein